MTVLEVIRSATEYLSKHGVEQPRLNAEHLLAAALGRRRLDLYLEFDRPLSDQERAPLRDTVRRRGAGEPLQYLLGEWDFCGRTFHVDSRALIPRPETEQLVEFLLAEPFPENSRVCDVGTGSGVIAVTLALERPTWCVAAIDLEEPALSLAKENAARHGVIDRIDFHLADLHPDEPVAYDLVAANLPYIPSTDLQNLQREVRFEPRSALDGGGDGLEAIRRLVNRSTSLLKPGGLLALEFGVGQAENISRIASGIGALNFRVEKDHQDIPRFAFLHTPE
jgi:release factor glutamine methyltransferase